MMMSIMLVLSTPSELPKQIPTDSTVMSIKRESKGSQWESFRLYLRTGEGMFGCPRNKLGIGLRVKVLLRGSSWLCCQTARQTLESLIPQILKAEKTNSDRVGILIDM